MAVIEDGYAAFIATPGELDIYRAGGGRDAVIDDVRKGCRGRIAEAAQRFDHRGGLGWREAGSDNQGHGLRPPGGIRGGRVRGVRAFEGRWLQSGGYARA